MFRRAETDKLKEIFVKVRSGSFSSVNSEY